MNRQETKLLMQKLVDENKLPLIEVHMLVPSGPSLLNRDYNNRIKTISVGGVNRVRVSSQSKKRPIRVKEYTDNTTHSKYLPQKLAKKLEAMGKDDTYIQAALQCLFGKDVKSKGSGQILAFCDHDIDEIASIITDAAANADSFKAKGFDAACKKSLIANAKERTVDDTTCLMGRMSTDPSLVQTVEAACHLSHMYSIDAWHGDNDTYTAVDDMKAQFEELDFVKWLNDDVSDQGAAYIDACDIASNVFYGYTNISTRTLIENKLRNISADDNEGIKRAVEESRDIIRRYISDYIMISPQAKQTSCATSPMPLAVLITAGTEVQPITADSVFEKVINGTENNSVGDQGVKKLCEFATNIAEGSFAINQYQKMFWISDMYKSNIPSACKLATLNSTLNELLSIVGE